MKHLLKMSDLSPAELHHILDVAEELKAEQKAGTTPTLLKGRSVALMFSKNSTRTHLPPVRSGRVCRAGRCARDQRPD